MVGEQVNGGCRVGVGSPDGNAETGGELGKAVVPAQVHQTNQRTLVRREPTTAVTLAGDNEHGYPLDVSYGDQSRSGEACDGVTEITDARAATLKAAGVKYVGRYLTNPSATSLPERRSSPVS